MAKTLFDPEKHTITVNGRVITGWDEASAEHDQERFTGYRSGDGKVYVGKDPCLLGTLTLTLPMVNAHTAYLDNLALSDKAFPVSSIDRSASMRSARASRARIKKQSAMDRQGKDPTKEVWAFVCEDLTIGYMGAETDDVAAIPVDDET
jgi:hypothetical protein